MSHAGNSDVEWVWNGRQCSRQACEAVSASDLRHHPMASEQQVGQGPPAGGRPHLKDCRRHEDLSRGIHTSVSLCRRLRQSLGGLNIYQLKSI